MESDFVKPAERVQPAKGRRPSVPITDPLFFYLSADEGSKVLRRWKDRRIMEGKWKDVQR